MKFWLFVVFLVLTAISALVAVTCIAYWGLYSQEAIFSGYIFGGFAAAAIVSAIVHLRKNSGS